MLSFFIKDRTGRREIPTISKQYNEKFSLEKSNLPPYKTEELFCMAYEPKTLHRFIVYLNDRNDNKIIDSFVIKQVDRPSFKYNIFGKKVYKPLNMVLYDPIIPSSMQKIYSHPYNDWNITIRLLGPCGDVIENWDIKNAKLQSVNSSTMDWSNNGDPLTIMLTFKIKNVNLLF